MKDQIIGGISAGVTAVLDTETMHEFKHAKPIKALYNLLKPELVEHSSAHNIHQHVIDTVRNYQRTLTGRMHKIQQELKVADLSSQAAKNLKEEISALTALTSILKKISAENKKSSQKIDSLEKTLEKIIAFGESYAVSKGVGYLGQYTVILAGLVGIPALGVTLAFPITQTLAIMIAKKHYQELRGDAEEKGFKIAASSKNSLQGIALDFLESKTPSTQQSAEQIKYLQALKIYIQQQPDINKILAAINDYHVSTTIYNNPKDSYYALTRSQWVQDKIETLQTELKLIQGQEQKFAEKSGYSHEEAQGKEQLISEKAKILSQITLLQSEQAILQPIVASLPKNETSISPKKMTRAEYKQALKISIQEDHFRQTATPGNGINIRNMQRAKETGFSLGGTISPSEDRVVSPFSPTPSTDLSFPSPSSDDADSSDDEALMEAIRSSFTANVDDETDSSDDEGYTMAKEGLNPASLLKLPLEKDEDQDEENMVDNPLSKETQKLILTKLDSYINSHAVVLPDGKLTSKRTLRFSADENILKARSAMVFKNIIESQDPSSEVLKNLGAEKEKYLDKHSHTDNPNKSHLIKMVIEIESLISKDQVFQAHQAPASMTLS